MATLPDLIAELTSLARIDMAAENFSSDDLADYITKALSQHDQYLTIDTLPVAEEEPVLTLAWAKLCLVRASKYANEANLNGGTGYGRDNNTPYEKNLSLSRTLIERYSDLCSKLKLGGKRIVMGTLFVRDNIYDAMVPLLQNMDGPRLILSFGGVPQQTDTSVVLRWNLETVKDFYTLYIFTRTDDQPIYQEWNNDSGTGVPRISDGSIQRWSTLDNTQSALKVINLERTLTNRFIAVLRTRSQKFAYSNEIVLSDSSTPVVEPPTGSAVTGTYRYVGDTAEGNVKGNIGDMCILIPSLTVMIKSSGMGTTTGWT